MDTKMIDRLREQIQQRLDQLAHEADRLRKALAALDPRSPKAPTRKPPARKPPVRTPAQATATEPSASGTKRTSARPTSHSATPSPRRTAPGATKASVLGALAGGEAMTAGEVATKTGLARATVSTTLSKLAKTGEVQKAERGYRLASTDDPPAAPPATPAASGD
jgi:CRP-like cAMP-binding protein